MGVCVKRALPCSPRDLPSDSRVPWSLYPHSGQKQQGSSDTFAHKRWSNTHNWRQLRQRCRRTNFTRSTSRNADQLSSKDYSMTRVSKRGNGYAQRVSHPNTICTKLLKTDLNYLASKAGDRDVLVEPMHPTAQQFGTDVERVSMKFGDFLESLKKDGSPHHYLTTQYAEQDLDAITVLPPPTDALADDFPRVPGIMGNLCLEQVNLWVGRSKDGSTSGLVRPSPLSPPFCLILVRPSTTTSTTTCTACSRERNASSSSRLPRSKTCTRTARSTRCTLTASSRTRTAPCAPTGCRCASRSRRA